MSRYTWAQNMEGMSHNCRWRWSELLALAWRRDKLSIFRGVFVNFLSKPQVKTTSKLVSKSCPTHSKPQVIRQHDVLGLPASTTMTTCNEVIMCHMLHVPPMAGQSLRIARSKYQIDAGKIFTSRRYGRPRNLCSLWTAMISLLAAFSAAILLPLTSAWDASFNSQTPIGHTNYADGLFTPVESLSSLSTAKFTKLGHPFFPRYSVRVKKSQFCDETVKSVYFLCPCKKVLKQLNLVPIPVILTLKLDTFSSTSLKAVTTLLRTMLSSGQMEVLDVHLL